MVALDVFATPASCSGTAWAAMSRRNHRANHWAACSSTIVIRANRRGKLFGFAAQSRSWNESASKRRGRRAFHIFAIDAAQEFDFESVKLSKMNPKRKLKVGIVGFGNFGQFLAERFAKRGHEVLAYSRSDYSDVARQLGITYFSDADDFCEEHPHIVVLCTSILSTEAVLHSLPIQRLERNTLFVDVLSVKEFPRNLLLQNGRDSWAGLPFMFERVRVLEGLHSERCSSVLNVFESEGCRMVEMSCEEHDRHAAGSQFITHTVGRTLGSLGSESTPIDTKGFESLLKLVDNTTSDSFDLYYGLVLYNNNATEELVRLEQAFDIVKSQLFNKLRSVIRQQILKTGTKTTSVSSENLSQTCRQNAQH